MELMMGRLPVVTSSGALAAPVVRWLAVTAAAVLLALAQAVVPF